MNRIHAMIDHIVFYLLSASLASLVGICFAQVVARYVLNASFSWAEEVSIVLMVWATWGGASLAVKQRTHLRILIVAEKLNPKTRLALELALNGLAIVFLTVVALSSKTIISGMTNMTLFSLPSVPMNVFYVSIPAGCVLMMYYLLRVMLPDWKSFKALPREQE
jgi:TRAP-type C4-dicarboxylate transport system permease small subunit